MNAPNLAYHEQLATISDLFFDDLERSIGVEGDWLDGIRRCIWHLA